jgi:saccharopine dehydrogenase-like NADP-dependent oxidoreductase
LGLTDESEHRVDAFLAGKVEIRKYLNIGQNSEEEELLNYLELSEKLQALQGETFIPAKFLQGILEEKWKLSPGDKDMVVMVHELEYKGKGTKRSLQSAMVYIGKDEEHTAMAITVGLPVAMVTRMILNNRINRRGVLMPVYSEIYNPILAELKNYGIEFTEKVS